MTKIANFHDGPLSFGSVIIQPGTAEDVPDWDEVSKSGVVRAWLEAGVIRKGDVPQADRDEDGDTPEMAEMRRRFDASYAELVEEIDRLKSDLAERDNMIAGLRAQLDGRSGGDGGPADAAPLVVKDKGRGWFAIAEGDREVTKSLREDDVKGFDAKSDAEKAAFVAANRAD